MFISLLASIIHIIRMYSFFCFKKLSLTDLKIFLTQARKNQILTAPPSKAKETSIFGALTQQKMTTRHESIQE